MNHEEFQRVVAGFMDLVSHTRNFPLHVIREGFRQNAIAGADDRYVELMKDALGALELAQIKIISVADEMRQRYGTSPPEVSTGPSAVGTRRKERVDASGLKLVEEGTDANATDERSTDSGKPGKTPPAPGGDDGRESAA